MKAVHKRRLLKLAAFLDTLQINHFDIQEFVTEDDGKCGTVCCAIGWCPKVFPRQWKWQKNEHQILYPVLKGYVMIEETSVNSVTDFFGLFVWEIVPLFCRSGYPMRKDVTPKQVSKRIREFVAAD